MSKIAAYVILGVIAVGSLSSCSGETDTQAAERESRERTKKEIAKRGWTKLEPLTAEDFQRSAEKRAKTDDEKSTQE